jgi:uncharacterized membrane protein YdbT with pleckstrin-like domain
MARIACLIHPEEACFMEAVNLRPNWRVFVIRPLLWSSLFLGLAAFVAYLVLQLNQVATYSPLLWLAGYLAMLMLMGFARQVRYRKTSYALLGDRVIHRTGGLLSEATTELQYRQITQVRLRLPFLEHRFFGTGHLTLMAAGSTLSHVVFEAIDEPRAIYGQVGANMRRRGFSLSRESRLQDERPSRLASLFDMGSHVVTVIAATLGVLIWGAGLVIDILALDGYGGLIGLLSGALDGYGNDWDIASMRRTVWGLGLVGVGVVIWTLTATILHYIDLTRRRYTLYEDVIDYEDGFLTETFEFIPIENLSDVEINEPLLKRALGVADVMLSCQGAGSHIRFTSMPNALRFKGSLERLLEARARAAAPTETDVTPTAPTSDAPEVRPKSVQDARPVRATGPRRELAMSMLRALAIPIVSLVTTLVVVFVVFAILVSWLPTVLGDEMSLAEIGVFLVFFVAISLFQNVTAMIKTAIKVHATRYVLGPQKVESRYEFVSKNQVEFAMERITGIVVRRTPLDRMLGTVTVSFRSIGSNVPLEFAHVDDDGDLVTDILSRLGLVSNETPRTFAASFGLGSWLRAYLPGIIAGGIIAAASLAAMALVHDAFAFGALAVIVIAVAAFAHGEAFHRRQRFEVFDGFLHIAQGIFVRTDSYFAFEHIKTVSSKRYPGINTGTIVIQAANHGGRARFIPAIERAHDWLDATLSRYGQELAAEPPELVTTPVLKGAPLLRNTVLRRLPVALVLPPLIIGLLWRCLAVKRIAYVVEAERLRMHFGVVYPGRTTVLFERIDHVRRTRGAIDKLSKTGAIEVYTVGSPTADLVVFDLTNDESFFEAIDARLSHRPESVQR